MLFDIIFRAIDLFKKYSLLIIVIVISTILILLWYMPILFGIPFIVTASIFLIAIFSPTQVANSLTRLCIFLFIFGLLFFPILISLGMEKHKLNNPELIIDSNNPTISKMASEFQLTYTDDLDDTEMVLNLVQDYVYDKYPYQCGHPYIFPTTEETVSREDADCRGRALIGYGILKEMGYDVYIVAGIVDGPHAWIRVFENGIWKDAFLMSENRPNFKPMIIFNEHESKWGSPLKQLYGALFYGFDQPNSLILFISLLFFVIPAGIGAIFILFLNKNKKIMVYFSAIVVALIVTFLAGLVGIILGHALMLLPVIIFGGIYLRILNQKFPSKNIT